MEIEKGNSGKTKGFISESMSLDWHKRCGPAGPVSDSGWRQMLQRKASEWADVEQSPPDIVLITDKAETAAGVTIKGSLVDNNCQSGSDPCS